MYSTDELLRLVAESLLEEEGSFMVLVDAQKAGLPLEGMQRLIIGGKATPDLEISKEGIRASLSINRQHHEVHIPWRLVCAVEGEGKAFYCSRETGPEEEKEDLTEDEAFTGLRLLK